MKIKSLCILLVLGTVISNIGCSQASLNDGAKDFSSSSNTKELRDTLKSEKSLATGHIRISPSSLFEGVTKKLEPHLGLTSGSVKVKYKGNKKTINSRYEIWELGKKKSVVGPMISTIEGVFDGDVSISLKNVSLNDKIVYQITQVINGSSATSLMTELAISKYGFSPLNIKKETEISDDKEIVVWGYVSRQDGIFNDNESIEECAKTSNWALVSILSMGD